MGAAPGDQRCGRGDEVNVSGRQVPRQVDHAARQRHGAEEGEAPGIRFGLGEVEQADAWRLQEHLHHQRLGRRGEHDCVGAAVEQLHDRGRLRFAQQRQRRGLELVGLHQPRHQVRHAAAGLSDVDAPAGELGQAHQLGRPEQPLGRVAAIEQPDRLVEQAAERDQAVVGNVAFVAAHGQGVVGAALDQGDVDVTVGLAQQCGVLGRAGGFLRHLMPFASTARRRLPNLHTPWSWPVASVTRRGR